MFNQKSSLLKLATGVSLSVVAVSVLAFTLHIAGVTPKQLLAAVTNSPCLLNAPTIKGTEGDDVLKGTAGKDVIMGYGGNDTIYGYEGDDILCGGFGDDTISGHEGDDYVSGDPGSDTITAGAGDDSIDGGNDDDVIQGNGGDDLINAHGGNDDVAAGDGNDTVNGGGGLDKIEGGPGDDVLFGQSDDDELWGGLGDDRLNGGGGNDALHGQAGMDRFDGSLGANVCKDVQTDESVKRCESDGDDVGVKPENPEVWDEEKPKLILFVMLDDADYYDVGYNSEDAITPNIDQLAAEGIRFTDYYAQSGICSPTRVSTYTGQLPLHFGINRLWPDVEDVTNKQYFSSLRGIPSGIPFITDVEDAGYSTFHIGKWHIGRSEERFTPVGQGFDKSVIMHHTPYEGKLKVYENGEHEVTTDEHPWRPTYQVDRIIDHIDNSQDEGPMFVTWWPIEPHAPLYVPPTFTAEMNSNCCNFNLNTNRGKLLSQMYAWDQEFGRLVTYLKNEGLYEDTLIVFTSDNGGYHLALSPQRLLRGDKATLSEGGIRVPFVATWPKRIPAGVSTNEVMTSADIFPTVLGAAGLPIPEGLAGVNMLDALFKKDVQDKPRFFQMRTVSWRKKEADQLSDEYALRDGCMKVIKKVDMSSVSMYDLCSDAAEMYDLSGDLKYSAQYTRLVGKLKEYRLNTTRYETYAEVSREVVLPHDDRLDINHDDISIYTTIDTSSVTGNAANLYKRGDGVNFSWNKAEGMLHLSLKGVTSTSTNPTTAIRDIAIPLPNDGGRHTVGFLVHGYLSGPMTVEVYVDGQMKYKLAGSINSTSVGNSLYAIISEDTPAVLGGNNVSLTDYKIFVTALRPDEI